MNVLLVNPEFPDTFWSFKHALKFIRKRTLSPLWGCSRWRRSFRKPGTSGWWTSM
jgi:hypothetical protein